MNDIEYVIFDEIHYINDTERGVVWEEVLIMLPPQVILILLSATTPNTIEFADWIGRMRKKEIYVISTLRRPIPLEHFVYIKGKIIKIVDADRQFLPAGYTEACAAAAGNKEGKAGALKGVPGGRLSSAARPTSLVPHLDHSTWNGCIQALFKKALLPVVIFTFSKRKCEEYVAYLGHVDLLTASEKHAVHVFFQSAIQCLKGVCRRALSLRPGNTSCVRARTLTVRQ